MAELQSRRVLAQGGFFALFLLAPVFDLFRLDLELGHFFFLGMSWTLGLDDFVAGRIDAGQAGLNIVLRAGVPIFSVIGLESGFPGNTAGCIAAGCARISRWWKR